MFIMKIVYNITENELNIEINTEDIDMQNIHILTQIYACIHIHIYLFTEKAQMKLTSFS